MVQTPDRTLTLAEFLQRPETKPATEWIDGHLSQKPLPQGKHSRLQGRLVAEINAVAEAPALALALPELRCSFGERSLVPDIAVFAWHQLPLDAEGEIANAFNAPPDWTIEILPPNQSQSCVTANILHCLNFGSQLGWLVDPQLRLVFAYPNGQQPACLQASQARLPVPDFLPELELTVGGLFGWLRPARSAADENLT